jgi:GNAT superfamily N-acetyltransferase
MKSILPLVSQWNKEVSKSTLKNRLTNMLKNDFNCLGAYQDKNLVGIVGYWIGYRFWCGKYIDVDNFIVDETQRGKGIGKLLMQEIYKIAKKNKCEVSVLDTYTQNHRSHKFYFEENYRIAGFHFYKKL